MVCHRSSTTSTRVSSPLVQTMKGATRSEENRSSRFRVYSGPLRAFQRSFNDMYTASFELLDLTVHDISDSLGVSFEAEGCGHFNLN
ncbi:hypothetical protein Tco_1575690 [Tanacetum coccineum]